MTILANTINASRRWALIIAASVCICVAGPMRATESDASPADTAAATTPDKPVPLTKPAKARQVKKAAAKSGKPAKDNVAKADPKKIDDADATKTGATDQAISPAVANANAQLQTNAPTETPATLAAKADDILKGVGGKAGDDAATQPAPSLQLVAADQLNEVDRAIAADTPAPTVTTTTDAPAVVASSNSTSLDQTSLIGKVFIAFGGLLTLASAARMFVA